MFIKRSKYEAMEARIKELEAEHNDYLIKMAEQTIRINELLIEKAELQLREIEMQEYMEDYLDDIKWKAEQIKDELDGANEYIAELEEELFKENPNHILVRGMAQYYGERDAIDATCTVVDEVLLLMAPVEEVKTTITTTVITTVATEMSDGTIVTETTTTTKKEEIDSRIKKALRGFKGNVSERRTPPLPPHRRKAC
jgi:DNA repair exonuclease SbcCD ATPase subunit